MNNGAAIHPERRNGDRSSDSDNVTSRSDPLLAIDSVRYLRSRIEGCG